MGRKTQVKCHGDDSRFEAVAQFVHDRFGNSIKYIADVAGGQGMLARILNKKYNYDAEVIDPRQYQLVGVNNRGCEYTSDMAGFYDLIIGLHPDEAVREVVESAKIRPVLVVPCCNFWDRSKKLGAREMIVEITKWLDENGIKYETVTFDFKGPKNVGILTCK
ncbi:MAG: hypothetical protein J5602_03765 [Clostridia bacterium]|nr:hypothetical protein [Clostridia bacterium]MBO4884410.1 hypothetical protein [Clostridia bacterium]